MSREDNHHSSPLFCRKHGCGAHAVRAYGGFSVLILTLTFRIASGLDAACIKIDAFAAENSTH